MALAVFLGHLFPVFLGFKGGKGVATALGVLLGFNPWMGLLGDRNLDHGRGDLAHFVAGRFGGSVFTPFMPYFFLASMPDPGSYHHVLVAHLAA